MDIIKSRPSRDSLLYIIMPSRDSLQPPCGSILQNNWSFFAVSTRFQFSYLLVLLCSQAREFQPAQLEPWANVLLCHVFMLCFFIYDILLDFTLCFPEPYSTLHFYFDFIVENNGAMKALFSYATTLLSRFFCMRPVNLKMTLNRGMPHYPLSFVCHLLNSFCPQLRGEIKI